MLEPDERECCATTTDCYHLDDCAERPAAEFLGRFQDGGGAASTPESGHVAEAVHALLMSDAMTGNHDGTPEHYIVEAENVDYLVRTVLDAAYSAATEGAAEQFAEALHRALWGVNATPGMTRPLSLHTADPAEYAAQREHIRDCLRYVETTTGLVPTNVSLPPASTNAEEA